MILYMLPAVARHLICPAHEWLLGRRTFRYLRELEWSQWESPDDIRRLQRAKLAALLAHAATHSAFYRARFRAAGIDAERDDPFEVLTRLPLLDKDQIRAHLDDMIWHGAPGGLFEHNTGGSTGEPLVFFFDRRRQGYDQAARIRTHRWFNVDIGHRELYLWGSPIELGRTDQVRSLRDRLFNHRLLDAFNMSPRDMDGYLDEIERYRPACLFGYPSSIALLAEHARSCGRMVDTRGLRAVFVTGEVCYPHHRATIADYFQVPVADCYGSREAGFIAHECPRGRLHLTAENVIVEIIEGGRVVPCGEPGEIVVTHLDAYAMAFIRYRTGDRGRLQPGRCPCGRGLPMMDVVQGRATDFLSLPDGTIKHALSIIYPLREQPGVRRFRVTQAADYGVSIMVVRDERCARVTRETIERCIRRVVGDQIRVEIEFVDRIPTTGSGKYRYVESHAATGSNRTAAEASCV